jgi:hypothetical protein
VKKVNRKKRAVYKRTNTIHYRKEIVNDMVIRKKIRIWKKEKKTETGWKKVKEMRIINGVVVEQYRPRLNLRKSYVNLLRDECKKRRMKLNYFMTYLLGMGWQAWNRHMEEKVNE